MEPDEPMVDNKPNLPSPIVGIGASAGGLHSLDCFLEALPKVDILDASTFFFTIRSVGKSVA